MLRAERCVASRPIPLAKHTSSRPRVCRRVTLAPAGVQDRDTAEMNTIQAASRTHPA